MRKHKDDDTRRGLIGFLVEYWRQLVRYSVTGLLVWIPLIITIWVSWFFIRKFVFGVELAIRGLVLKLNTFGAEYPSLWFLEHVQYRFGLGVMITIALFLSTGFFTRFIVGQRIIALGEQIVQRIPVISRIYRAVQQIRDVFIGRKGTFFQKVCLVQYPRAGMIAMGFVTSREHGLVQEHWGEELVAVFIPTTPNPTSGYLVYLHPDEVIELDITVEEAMKLIVSAGAYIPDRSLYTPAGKRRSSERPGTQADPDLGDFPKAGDAPGREGYGT